MALSDVCAESFSNLIDGFIDYHAHYVDKDFNKIFKVIFELAELIVKYDAIPGASDTERGAMVNNLVVNSLFAKVGKSNLSPVISRLRRVSKLNEKFARALDEVYQSYANEDIANLSNHYAKIFRGLDALQKKRDISLDLEMS